MYILASDFFEKDENTYLKLEIRVVCREFLAWFPLFNLGYPWLYLVILWLYYLAATAEYNWTESNQK